jgi:hypothetical protein
MLDAQLAGYSTHLNIRLSEVAGWFLDLWGRK